jgi:hypothetical protein
VGIENDPNHQDGSRLESRTRLGIAAHYGSHLFTVRLWSEVLGDGRTEWRGQVQHVTSQERCYFREWTTLESFLERKLVESQA